MDITSINYWDKNVKKRFTQDSFIAKAKEVHGGKYSYEEAVYVNAHVPVTIFCKIHGAFIIKPYVFLKGYGCPGCKIEHRHNSFIDKANTIHNHKYNYDNAVYVNASTKVKIVCPVHGKFNQTPNSHLNKRGCPLCHSKSVMTTERFISRALEKHGDLYDYSKVDYRNINSHVLIRCPRCKSNFKQLPKNHLTGSGCMKCSRDR